ncbi:MAG: SusC/RagA family TonB-linked outer membrane protein, partial [Bacteroidales bacterium]|nr:SusC/RagA family TonB-linked outer membrane protein [Bacteroidales bacterium]
DDSNRGANPIADLNYGGQSQFQSFQGWYDAKLVQKLDFITEGLKAHAQVSFNQATATRSNIKNGGIFGTSDVASQHLFPREYRTYDYSSPVIGPDGSIAYPIIESASGFHGNLYYATPQSVGYDNLNSVSRLLYYEIGLNYARTFGNHEVTAMALMNRQKREESSNGSTFAFPSFMEDWVGRVTYNWKERYLAEFNISYTGSEKFAPGKRFGLFPSYSIGWRVTEEPWMQWSKDVLSNMKIRYSWGKVGNDRGADRFQYIQLYTQESNVNFGWKENVAFGPSYKEGDIAQPNATWETSVKQNIGLEIGLWKKLRTTIDLFDEQRSGILLSPRTTAAWVGVDIASANLGRTKNHGIDLELSWNDKIGKDFHYTASFMFSTSENRILYKDDPANYLSHEKDAGKPVGWQSRFITIGNYEDLDDIYNAAQTTFIAANKVVPGDLVYVDFNADGTINNKDNIVQQQLNYPLTTYSLNLSCEWKGLGLSLMFYSPQGQYRNYVEAYLYNWLNGHVKAQPHAEDRWTPATANVTGVRLPSAHVVDTHNQKENTFRYVDYSYVRLKNAEITYQVPKKVQRALHMSKFTVFANGNNLITWWKGDPRIDPETDGQDIYPIVRTYTFGARFSF